MTKKSSAMPRQLQRALDDPDFDGWDAELALAFSSYADDEMLNKIQRDFKKIPRIRDKITHAVRTRLELLEDYKPQVKSAMKALAHIPHGRHLPAMVWQTADCIWDAAGDTATDYNRYTKRLLLSGVLTTTTLFWLKDHSAGNEKTWGFLDKRIENVMSAGKFLSRFKKSA